MGCNPQWTDSPPKLVAMRPSSWSLVRSHGRSEKWSRQDGGGIATEGKGAIYRPIDEAPEFAVV